jgi:hypothetical protein
MSRLDADLRIAGFVRAISRSLIAGRALAFLTNRVKSTQFNSMAKLQAGIGNHSDFSNLKKIGRLALRMHC